MVGKTWRWDQFLSGWREYKAAGHTSEAGRWQKDPGLEVKQDLNTSSPPTHLPQRP